MSTLSSYFDKLFSGVDEGLRDEFLQVKELHERDFPNYRDEFTNVFWKLYESVASLIDEHSPLEQKFFLRVGIVDPRYITKEDLGRLREVFEEVESEIFYYADEWLIAVKKGLIAHSTFEEAPQEPKPQRSTDVSWLRKEYERKVFERSIEEEKLRDLVSGVRGKGPYTKGVYVVFEEIQKTIGNLKRMDGEIKNLHDVLKTAEERSKNTAEAHTHLSAESEVRVLRQMVRKTLGKTGIPYPALSSNFLRDVPTILTKKKASQLFEEFTKLDPTILLRKVRGATVFMPPYFLLLPGYGEFGHCWEPVEGTNPYGRGRVFAPIFSRKGVEPFFQAFGDYRIWWL